MVREFALGVADLGLNQVQAQLSWTEEFALAQNWASGNRAVAARSLRLRVCGLLCGRGSTLGSGSQVQAFICACRMLVATLGLRQLAGSSLHEFLHINSLALEGEDLDLWV